MAKKKIILGQDKNYKGKLPKKELEKAINKLKTRYRDHSDDSTKIAGFEINGGTGLTNGRGKNKGGQQLMDDFQRWAKERGMDAVYNSKDDLDNMTIELRNRIKNKNKNGTVNNSVSI